MEDKRKNVIVILAGYEPVLAFGGVVFPLGFATLPSGPGKPNQKTLNPKNALIALTRRVQVPK